MPPPKLAGDAPRLDIFHPVEIGFFPSLRHDLDRTRAHGLNRGLGQGLGIDIPLIGQPWLNHLARAVAIRRLDHAILHLIEQTCGLNGGDHFLARLKPIETQIVCRDQPIDCLHNAGFGIEHVEHVSGLEACTFADFEIVKVMAGRNLNRARPQFRIRMLIGHNRDFTARNRQANGFPDQRLIAIILWIYRDRHIGEHRFRSRGRNQNMPTAIGQRIAKMPKLSVHFARFDLKVRNRGFQARIPIHQPFVAIDQPLIIEIDKDLEDGAAKAFIHRKAFIGPIHRAAKAAQLAGDLPAGLFLPVPDFGDKVLAREVGALLPLGIELTFDHHLRCNTRMVCADDPERILALKPGVADQNILQRIVERMADMQVARHIGRRIDDRIGFSIGAIGAECARFFPMGIPFGLNGRRIESLGQF